MATKHALAATVTGLALTGVVAFAGSDTPAPLASPLTFNEAIAIVLAEEPSDVAEIALERSDSAVVIEIEMVNEDGEYEFHLDPETGEILASWRDDDPSDDPAGDVDDDLDN